MPTVDARTAEPDADPAITPAQHYADCVQAELQAQDRLWDGGFTRRKFLAGAGMVSVAALASQLVTTRVAYAAPATGNGKTVISVFLRGAADGLRILVPASSDLGVDYLHSVRPGLVPATSTLLPLTGGWALNAAMAPLMPYWSTGELAFVPAVSAQNISRSHFQAQQSLERGGSDTFTTGWLDRALTQLGPGTTFRAVAQGQSLQASLVGDQPAVAMDSLKNFVFPGAANLVGATETVLTGLYRGLDSTLAGDVLDTIGAIDLAAQVSKAAGPVANGAVYPAGSSFSSALQNLAALIRGGSGLQVATVDVGGWDTHTNEATELDQTLNATATTLAAFMTDLGPALRANVTVVVTTEFGRRVAMNASGGTDHGHGSVMWLLGGGLAGAGVYGQWNKLSASMLDTGDVPGLNNAYDVLGEILQKRLSVGSLNTVFPSLQFAPLSVARSAA